jgi:hypothetical protein
MQLPEPLRPALDLLRQAYPRGVPERDYLPLLVVLHEHFAEGNLAAVVAELTDGETVVVENDAAAAMSTRRPDRAAVERVRARLTGYGLLPDDEEDD